MGELPGYRATIFYSNLHILKLPGLFKLEIAKFVHRFMHSILPQSFSDIFVKAGKVTTRTNRSNLNNLYIPRYKPNKIQLSTKYQGVEVWNPICDEI